LLRSASARFALLFTVIFAAAGATFAVVLWWGTAGALDRQSQAAVRADAMALVERWRDSGEAGTIEAIEERLANDVTNETLYLLATPQGEIIAGNIERWPPEADGNEAWIHLPLVREGGVSEARLYRQLLPGGYRLLVGRDEAEKLRLRALLSEGIAWAALAAAGFALLGAWLLRRALERRLAPATRTAVSIAAGDLSHRVPLSDRRDEFDRLGATMNAMLDRIERLMEGVRGVSDAIAHDLRTPIARARAQLEEALAGPEDAASLRAALEQGIADLDAISRVFQAVLRIAEVEAGARRAAFAPLDLAPLLGDAAELYGASAEAHGQVLETELPERLEMVGDRDLLLQAVANLLDNAVKFTPAGGRIRLWAREDGDSVEMGVSDDGPGLSPEDRGRAHERFFRADTARATPGSGLGLALVQAVAQLHGGELALRDAAPGRESPGLAAVLRLPVSLAA
jgi:signal transduction histidine kinase